MDSKVGGFTTGTRVSTSNVPAAIAGSGTRSGSRTPDALLPASGGPNRDRGRSGRGRRRGGRSGLPAGPPLPPNVTQELNDRAQQYQRDVKTAESNYASGMADAAMQWRQDKGVIQLEAGQDRRTAGQAAASTGLGFSGAALGAAQLRIRDTAAAALSDAASRRADRQATLDEMLALARSNYRNNMLGIERDKRRVKSEVAANIRGVA